MPEVIASIPRGLSEIVIIGGAGQVGRDLITLLQYEAPTISVILYSHSTQYSARLRAVLLDTPQPEMVRIATNISEVSNCDLLVIASGKNNKSTTGENLKERLYSSNFEDVCTYINRLTPRTTLIVTNPCTRIMYEINKQNIGSAYSVGVENDNIRFRKTCSVDDLFIVGGHNFFEYHVGSRYESLGVEKSLVFGETLYKEYSKFQNQQINEDEYSNLLSHLNMAPDHHKWWLLQRLNSQKNGSAYSCAKSICNIIKLLQGEALEPVVLELPLKFRRFEKHATIGWPIDPSNMRPVPLWFDKDSLSELKETIQNYSIGEFHEQSNFIR
ncbi:hypothetical protein [Saccharospirillum mangrovi]|uniref:hypothetical protein n=1 Tax=Saccharospirillum mangrovi TaxID=2161747 RepID=UPI00130074EA|nr:hypothetical protein [Saccharospirillum mangrovi]